MLREMVKLRWLVLLPLPDEPALAVGVQWLEEGGELLFQPAQGGDQFGYF